jgi:hypothetical protein
MDGTAGWRAAGVVLRMGLFMAVFPAVAGAAGLSVEDAPLRPSELKLLQRIASLDREFRYGTRAKRYYRAHPKTKNRIPLRVEVIAPQKDNLYFGEYLSYEMVIDEPAGMVTYSFDAGTAYRGRGMVMVNLQDVLHTTFSCGLTACSTRVSRNGKAVFEDSRDFKK